MAKTLPLASNKTRKARRYFLNIHPDERKCPENCSLLNAANHKYSDSGVVIACHCMSARRCVQVSVASCEGLFIALMSYDQYYLIVSDKSLGTDEAYVQLMYIRTVKPAGLIINLNNAGMWQDISPTAWHLFRVRPGATGHSSRNGRFTTHRCRRLLIISPKGSIFSVWTLKNDDAESKQLIWLWVQPSHMQPTLTRSRVCTIKADLLMFHKFGGNKQGFSRNSLALARQ